MLVEVLGGNSVAAGGRFSRKGDIPLEYLMRGSPDSNVGAVAVADLIAMRSAVLLLRGRPVSLIAAAWSVTCPGSHVIHVIGRSMRALQLREAAVRIVCSFWLADATACMAEGNATAERLRALFGVASSSALDLVFPNDALVPVHLALNPVLKYATRFGELSNNFVAASPLGILARAGRKMQSLPDGEFMHCHCSLQELECLRRHSGH